MTENQVLGLVGWRWEALLVLLVLTILIQPLFGASVTADFISLAIFEVALLGAIFASELQKRFRVFSCAIALIWFATSVALLHGRFGWTGHLAVSNSNHWEINYHVQKLDRNPGIQFRQPIARRVRLSSVRNFMGFSVSSN